MGIPGCLAEITLTSLNVMHYVGISGKRRSKGVAPPDTVVVYLPVSTSEQAASGLGIEAQRATARAYAERKGLQVVEEFCDEGISAKNLSGRPGALAALDAVRSKRAAGLLVAKMDRLSRSVVDGAGLMELARREGWALYFADLDIDTSTPAGEMAATIIISGSQYERRLISQRTRDALAAKRARGEKLGAAPRLPPDVLDRILREREQGLSFRAIGHGLTEDRVPTSRGHHRWLPATVRAVTLSDHVARRLGDGAAVSGSSVAIAPRGVVDFGSERGYALRSTSRGER
ncbi:resolvase domain-containing protein [Mycolicibacterium neoaurum]|uniref:Resolvase domain-containing protein n=2 Tax=Mycolicibacterium neoaurum TaxID=1795 RepID=A0AAV2WHK1_MYCNE|nr:resolvase domain-containing protein [Mycolicibacterium neoaurum]